MINRYLKHCFMVIVSNILGGKKIGCLIYSHGLILKIYNLNIHSTTIDILDMINNHWSINTIKIYSFECNCVTKSVMRVIFFSFGNLN